MSNLAVPQGHFAGAGEGLRIHYQDAGEKDGPVLLLLHGSGPGASGYSNFKHNYPFFAAHGYRTIVPDTLGYGYSDKPDTDYHLDFLVLALKRFLDSIGVTRCAVLGNSHGGAMAIKLALDYPELVGKLILLGPGGLEVRDVYMKMDGIRAMMKAFMAPEGITRESMRRVFSLQLFDPTLITDELIEERHQIAVTQPRRVLVSMVVPHLAPELSRIQCPVFGFWGMNDKFCPVSGATTLAGSCKRARVMLINECGHWVMVEHAALFNRLSLDFLDEAA